jgi:uncharacterized protein with PQ loop repeat
LVPFTEQARIFHKNHLEKHRLDKEMTRKIDHLMAVVGVMGPFATLFQVVHIFVVKTAAGISVYTWIGYMIVSLCWFIYGFFYKDKPLMIVNSLCFVIDAFLIVGFALYH